jgi:hypothetical protein
LSTFVKEKRVAFKGVGVDKEEDMEEQLVDT